MIPSRGQNPLKPSLLQVLATQKVGPDREARFLEISPEESICSSTAPTAAAQLSCQATAWVGGRAGGGAAPSEPVPAPCGVRAPAAGWGRRLWAVAAGARALPSSSRFALPRKSEAAVAAAAAAAAAEE